MGITRLTSSVLTALLSVCLVGCSLFDATTRPPATTTLSVSTTNDSQAGAVDNPDKPVVTDDGRMLQPQGHEGIWFETEPDDPWGKYVWRSQKFVGDPLELPVLGESAEFGAGLKGLPDYCAPEVERRLESIGLIATGIKEGWGRRQCSFRNNHAEVQTAHSFRFAVWFVDAWPLDPPSQVQSESGTTGLKDVFSVPGLAMPRDCVAMIDSPSPESVYATQSEPDLGLSLETICLRAAYSRQIFLNARGN